MPGSGTMTPLGGLPASITIAQPLPYTLLSIYRYAKIMGISPMHFARGATPGLNPVVFPNSGCDDIWFKYDWQDHDKVSWTQLVQVISEVEYQIATLIGYWPAPVWTASEMQVYPRPYRREYFGTGLDIRGEIKSVKSDYGYFLEAGRRAVTLIGTATAGGGTLAYIDADGDGFYETATVTIPTTLTDVKEIRVFFAGFSGDKEWEIRSPRSAKKVGANFVAEFDSWQFIDPDLYEDYPTDIGLSAIDISTTANFVTSVEVYREYTDFTQASAQFIWESSCNICGGSGCASCSPALQDGCLHARDDRLGHLVAVPATYDSSSASWTPIGWDQGYEPSRLRLWYRSGVIDPLYTRGATTDPLSNEWAMIISKIVTARLERPLCGCSNIQNVCNSLQTDMTYSDRSSSYFNGQDVMTCPLGTRRGEVEGWRRIRSLRRRKLL